MACREEKAAFYGEMYPLMEAARDRVLGLIDLFSEEQRGMGRAGEGCQGEELHSIVYCKSRIKSPDSMRQKLEKRGLPLTCRSALENVHDGVGVRVICAFSDDVSRVAGWLEGRRELEILNRKDYMSYPKPNGYRSYHMVVRILEGEGAGMKVEIQLRTIAIDFWATLEHQMKYKKETAHEALIREELKRCADEIASVDLSMQAIRDFLKEG